MRRSRPWRSTSTCSLASCRASAKGWAFAYQNVEQAVAYLLENQPELDAANAMATAKSLVTFAYDETTRTQGWGAMSQKLWQDQIDLFQELGEFTARVPSANEVFTPDILGADGRLAAAAGLTMVSTPEDNMRAALDAARKARTACARSAPSFGRAMARRSPPATPSPPACAICRSGMRGRPLRLDGACRAP